jgi:hypothetical protein
MVKKLLAHFTSRKRGVKGIGNHTKFPETIGAMGRAALLRRRVCWLRSNAALPSGIGADYYRKMVLAAGTELKN